MEIWKEILGFENYQVSSYGNIRTLNYRRTGEVQLLKLHSDNTGYLRTGLCRSGKNITVKVHRVVAEAFIGNCNEKEVNHKDGNKANNHIDNLEIVTRVENVRHSFKELGRQSPLKGLRSNKHPKAKPVKQYSKEGRLIKIWPTAADAKNETGISSGNISLCCTGKRKTAGGFIWKH